MPDQRPDPGLLQGRGHHDHDVEAGTDALVEHLPRRAHLLPDVGPARRRLRANAPCLHRLVHGTDDLVDTPRTGLVALQRGTRIDAGHQRPVELPADASDIGSPASMERNRGYSSRRG